MLTLARLGATLIELGITPARAALVAVASLALVSWQWQALLALAIATILNWETINDDAGTSTRQDR